MACVALASLVATIKLELLQPFPRVLLQDEVSIRSFLEMISSLQAFLDKSSGAAAIRDLEIEIRDFALEAEDDIEIKLSDFLLAKDSECQAKASQELNQTLQGAAEKATELLKIIDSIISNEADEENKTQKSIHGLKYASESEKDKWDGSSRCSPEIVGKMVGRGRDRIEIINHLMWGVNLKIISIVGMVGIGKTTLTKSVYEDPKVKNHFNVCGWITMPQQYSKSRILQLLLRSISPAAEKNLENGSSPEELAQEVRRLLLDTKYLIVLDNLQDNRALNDIQICFPNDRNGSCILLTTRHSDSKYYDLSSYKYIHYMTLLDLKESWDLFRNTLSLKVLERMALEFESIRSHIVEICDGLPLLIVVVANLLSKCSNVLKEWEKIKKKIESIGILDRKPLTLSYNKLPQHLKVCFLYLGVFPKREEIKVKKLIKLWIAEGFLKALEDEELESQAYAYLKELIDRSLVLICKQDADGNIKICRTHSVLHSFCVGEAQKEGIFCAVNTLQHSGVLLREFADSCRWLSLYAHSFDYYVLSSTNNPRSILFFVDNFFVDDPEMTFVSLKLLRVLAFAPSPSLQQVSIHLRDLIFLRYLSVTQWFEGLDTVLSTSLNLQTIVVSGSESQPTCHLPSTIWELPHLRHLELGNTCTLDPPSVVKENLQTLSWVGSSHYRKGVYFSFPDIKKLKIFYEKDMEPSHCHESSNNPIILENLDYLKRLERLTISISVSCTVTHPEQFMFPSQLKKLRLSGTNLSEEDLKVIGRLPELRVLKLKNALLGTEWEVAEGGFGKLRFLLLEDKKLKRLVVYKHSYSARRPLQNLERLVLRFCHCLEVIPNAYEVIGTLQLIELDRCDGVTVML